ncbi:CAP domain-containing protein [Nocardioides sp. Soil805]|uniref:CAP domain-containing protein n=1 Tax=Nocardioides sp. Soil805 TaxID=1736416 RepID=UPI000703191E|nr:CAP domain-containing protein [Nocardioides sp. Soil805]KRF36489.1 hypothetical protein ASG94_03295 [Nocardioides sp. Soil805]
MSRIPPLLGTALLALVLAVPATAATAPAAARADGATSYAADAVRATNAARARHDLRALRSTRCLRRAATRQARAMARRESIWHQDIGAVMSTCGLGSVGENVAAGYPSGRAVVTGWMGSEGHRANILEPRYRLVAVAARRGGSGTWYAAQVFGRR